MTTLTNTFDVLLLIVAAYLVIRLVRARSRGKLPPGPMGLPVIGSVLDIPMKYQHIHFSKWSDRFGDIMSFSLLGQQFVILNSAEHAFNLLEKKSALYSSRAPIPVGGNMVGWSQAMILQTNGSRLRDMRKLVGTVMASHTRVERFHSLVEAETRAFLVGLPARTDTLFHEVQKLAGSIICMITYGYKSSGDGDAIVEVVDKAMEDFALVTAPGAFLADVFPFLRSIPSWVPGTQWKARVAKSRLIFNDMVELPYRWVKEQMAAGAARPSFASALLEDSKDPDREYLIKMASASMYAGGADTTVSSILSFFFAMSRFPEVQRKAQAELDTVIGHGKLPTIADRARLPYLNAVLLEVLRWIPVAPMGFPHQTTEDDFYSGYFLPKGTLVMVNIWNLLHDSQRYADPMTFNPDRFIATPTHSAEHDPRDFAFGFGRRKCPGIFFAEASIFAAISLTLTVYNITEAPGESSGPVDPAAQGSGNMISHPLPFKCSLDVRSDKAQGLVDSFSLE